jgi:hypothetical protein
MTDSTDPSSSPTETPPPDAAAVAVEAQDDTPKEIAQKIEEMPSPDGAQILSSLPAEKMADRVP